MVTPYLVVHVQTWAHRNDCYKMELQDETGVHRRAHAVPGLERDPLQLRRDRT